MHSIKGYWRYATRKKKEREREEKNNKIAEGLRWNTKGDRERERESSFVEPRGGKLSDVECHGPQDGIKSARVTGLNFF